MNVELTIAGVLCSVLALGHGLVGRWVLPKLMREAMPATPLGPRAATLGMLRFTWHAVTIVLIGFAVLLMIFAGAVEADPQTVVLRWLAALFLATTLTAFGVVRFQPRALLRPPIALVFPLVAAMCWIAS